jgi:hypothetical protein
VILSENGADMESQLQLNAIRKLAIAGEQAGFTLDQMIQLLNSGMSAEVGKAINPGEYHHAANGADQWKR